MKEFIKLVKYRVFKSLIKPQRTWNSKQKRL